MNAEAQVGDGLYALLFGAACSLLRGAFILFIFIWDVVPKDLQAAVDRS